MQIYGILSFPTLFQPKQTKDAAGNPTGDPKYSCAVLLPPGDPQVAMIHTAVEQAALDTFPSGFPAKGDKCFGLYDDRFRGKDYYDPRFSGWYVFSCTAKQEDKPAVVDPGLLPIMDPAKVFGGAMIWLNANISGYTKGTGGIGGWLNGVMVTDDEPTMGRLDNKPSVEAMFANLPTSHKQHLAAGAANPANNHVAANGARVTPPGQVAPPPTVTAPPSVLLMKPGLASYQDHKAAGWTDEMLLAQGMAVRPSF